jgi:hypothetical protein
MPGLFDRHAKQKDKEQGAKRKRKKGHGAFIFQLAKTDHSIFDH